MPGIVDPRIAGSLVRSPIAMHPAAMDTKNLGTLGTTSAIGLGLMAMSDAYGPSDRAESVATIHAALDAGIIMLDTGDFFGMGHNELLLEEALCDRDRDGVQISVKFGGQRDPNGAFLGFDGRPAAVRRRWPTHCNGLAPTTSTFTGRRALIPPCRSRTPWARSPT